MGKGSAWGEAPEAFVLCDFQSAPASVPRVQAFVFLLAFGTGFT